MFNKKIKELEKELVKAKECVNFLEETINKMTSKDCQTGKWCYFCKFSLQYYPKVHDSPYREPHYVCMKNACKSYEYEYGFNNNFTKAQKDNEKA